jgi:iron-sulfur cluster repair protein YtfE (RIC family)
MVNEIPTLDMTVKQILERWPKAAEALVRRGLDLCCGGVHPLRMAAQAHGQNPDEVLAEVVAAAEKK